MGGDANDRVAGPKLQALVPGRFPRVHHLALPADGTEAVRPLLAFNELTSWPAQQSGVNLESELGRQPLAHWNLVGRDVNRVEASACNFQHKLRCP